MNIEVSDVTLRGAGNMPLQVKGTVNAKLEYNNKIIEEKVYVVDKLLIPLLGKPAISKFSMIKVVESLDICDSELWKSKFPTLFRGLGSMKNEVDIQLKEGVTPFAQVVARRVAAARRLPLEEELRRMEEMGVIERIETPTEWCSPCIVVPKKNGKIRVCIDFTQLNLAVKREYHPLPTTEETIGALGDARFFTKLDANCGYWQMRLHPKAQRLTAFITPFGRFICKRLPFGISSAPEIYQREMQKALMGISNVVCQMDDVLIYSRSREEHQNKIVEVMTRLCEEGITLNMDKCDFSKSQILFLGHQIDESGIKADPKKVEAIQSFPRPENKKELKRFFGMVNYLGKFSGSLASDTKHLRELLGKEKEWAWHHEHSREFAGIKKKMLNPPTLAPFKLEAKTKVSADASSYGLGAAIWQKTNGSWKPIAFASRSMTEAERKYAQIEKEALAICWACEKFHYYLAGRTFKVETDHKPLVAVLGMKEIAKLPLRVQRFRLRMMAYSYEIDYIPGSKLIIADTLSRAPLPSMEGETEDAPLVCELFDSLSVTEKRVEALRAETALDPVGALLINFCQNGWPSYKKCPKDMKQYFTFKEELTTMKGIVFYHNRIYIPPSERSRTLQEIHSGHQGEGKCIKRAAEVVWWPGMTTHIRNVVSSCPVCTEFRRIPPEPMEGTPFPDRPWHRIAMDFCMKDNANYLVVVDYYSRYIAVEKTQNTDSKTVCGILEKLFFMLGMPHTIVSDNGPQFVSEEFQNWIKKYDITHSTSAPRRPQSNGEAERAVQTVKGLLNKNVNLQAALCAYRDTPLANGYSPAHLLFGRGMNSVGINNTRTVDLKRLRHFEDQARSKQVERYDQRHRVHVREPLQVSARVKVISPGVLPSYGEVIAANGREVIVRREDGQLLRRNRQQVVESAKEAMSEEPIVNRSPEAIAFANSQLNEPEPRSSDRLPEAIASERGMSPEAMASEQRTVVPEAIASEKKGYKSREKQHGSTGDVTTRSGRVSKAPKRLNL